MHLEQVASTETTGPKRTARKPSNNSGDLDRSRCYQTKIQDRRGSEVIRCLYLWARVRGDATDKAVGLGKVEQEWDKVNREIQSIYTKAELCNCVD